MGPRVAHHDHQESVAHVEALQGRSRLIPYRGAPLRGADRSKPRVRGAPAVSLTVGRVPPVGALRNPAGPRPFPSGLRSWGEGGLDVGDDLSSVFAGGAEHLLTDDLAAVIAAIPDLA